MRHAPPTLPLSQLQAWSHLNNVTLHGAKVEPRIIDKSGSDKGGGLIATEDHGPGEILLRVPREVVLSVERVKDARRVERGLREVWDALELAEKNREGQGKGLLQTPRGMILVFLIFQMTLAGLESHNQNPNRTETGDSRAIPMLGGVHNPLTDYVRFLPKDIPLPTFYSDEERESLAGTSLADALDQKLTSLEREFEALKEATSEIEWCRRIWWEEAGEGDGDLGGYGLDLDDWKLADAMYRSRALELPRGVGDAMVPVLDMANHASDDRSNARFEVDEDDGSTLLVVRDGKRVKIGEEITIMYGTGGACEMMFSYGFLEEGVAGAREVFLSLNMPLDDPLRVAKIRYSAEAPGVRVYLDEAARLQWDSRFVWWACVNEEDGLDFELVQSIDGQKELKALWKRREFDAGDLKSLLMKDQLRDIFVLRAVVLIQQRVEEQGLKIAKSEVGYDRRRSQAGVREAVWKLVGTLRDLELELLTVAFETLEAEKAELLCSDVVSRYFGSGDGLVEQNEEVQAEDFS